MKKFSRAQLKNLVGGEGQSQQKGSGGEPAVSKKRRVVVSKGGRSSRWDVRDQSEATSNVPATASEPGAIVKSSPQIQQVPVANVNENIGESSPQVQHLQRKRPAGDHVEEEQPASSRPRIEEAPEHPDNESSDVDPGPVPLWGKQIPGISRPPVPTPHDDSLLSKS